jgi:hypothetical protein
MLQRAKAEAVRFLAGLLVGGVVGATILALPLYLAGRMLGALPGWASLTTAVVLFVVLGVADLRQRTPHVWRQVPQSLWHRLTPGWLGVVWGFDLALLFTTQKTTSLIWACVVAVVLLKPSLVAVVLIAISVMSTVLVVVSTVTPGAVTRTGVEWSGTWVSRIRRGSGLLILAGATAVAVHGLTA